MIYIRALQLHKKPRISGSKKSSKFRPAFCADCNVPIWAAAAALRMISVLLPAMQTQAHPLLVLLESAAPQRMPKPHNHLSVTIIDSSPEFLDSENFNRYRAPASQASARRNLPIAKESRRFPPRRTLFTQSGLVHMYIPCARLAEHQKSVIGNHSEQLKIRPNQ